MKSGIAVFVFLLSWQAFATPPTNLRITPRAYFEERVVAPGVQELMETKALKDEQEALAAYYSLRGLEKSLSQETRNQVQAARHAFLRSAFLANHADEVKRIMAEHELDLESALIIQALRASKKVAPEQGEEKLLELLQSLDQLVSEVKVIK